MFKSLALWSFMLASLTLPFAPVHAGNSPVGDRVKVADLPYELIATLASAPGENEHAFLTRIAPQLRAYSDKTGFEACGIIASDSQGHYGVVLGSSHSHIGCANDPTRVAPGLVSTGETIHSHGKRGLRVPAVPADWVMMGNPQDPPHYMGGFDLSHFSDQDFQHPGYLATPNGLLYQNGPRTSVAIR